MPTKRKIIVPVLVFAILLAIVPFPVNAAVVGNTYTFSATWNDYEYSVDNQVIRQSTESGTFSILVYNVTPSRYYEYTFDGMNYHPHVGPFVDQQNDSVHFEDYTVAFDLDTTDDDEDDVAEAYNIDVYPAYSEHTPGHMFFVNPTWTTHASDWNEGVTDANANPTVSNPITSSRSDDVGSFSFSIVVNVEQDNEHYGNLTGTCTIAFSASYDDDGVLSTWELTQTIAMQNEDHVTNEITAERYTRGAGIALNNDIVSTAVLGSGILVVGVVIGVLIAKRYWG
ncbi:MAG: hypothetical protein P1Q69_00090 [Candidatus Thorarchaeota archaeon]|nr:hypothetical protein [Candidatus Thorarchaeota archaeon]